MARDAAVLTQRVHLLVRLRLDVHHIFGTSQQLGEVPLDRRLVRANLWPLRDDGAIDVSNLAQGSISTRATTLVDHAPHEADPATLL